MARYVALLRAVNVGGRSRLPMADLRRVVEEVGHTDVATVQQSGNVAFSTAGGSDDESPAHLAGEIEQALAAGAGLDTRVLVLSGDDLDGILAANPFPEVARDDPSHLLLSFLWSAPPLGATIDARYLDLERVEVRDRVAYLWYPGGVGRSKLTGAVIERALHTTTTARNWNTATKLLQLLHAADQGERASGTP